MQLQHPLCDLQRGVHLSSYITSSSGLAVGRFFIFNYLFIFYRETRTVFYILDARHFSSSLQARNLAVQSVVASCNVSQCGAVVGDLSQFRHIGTAVALKGQLCKCKHSLTQFKLSAREIFLYQVTNIDFFFKLR